MFAELHREHGVDLRLKASVEAITTEGGRATGLQLGDGTTVEADAVLVGVGAKPNIELAEQAGLQTADGGVSSTRRCGPATPTSSPSVTSPRAQHPLLGTRIRVEHWANALNQPQWRPRACLASPPRTTSCPTSSPTSTTWAWSTSGMPPDYDPVVFRGDLDEREFIAFWLDAEGRVLAGMNVNVWDVLDDIKALIRSRKPVDAGRLANPDVPLGELGG